jgi:hypothetical protein
MRDAFKFLIIFLCIILMLIGIIFLIAGGETENYITGGIMLLVAFALLAYIYLNSRVEARRPIHQEFHVTMGSSGDLKEKEMSCKSCGAPLTEKNLTVIKGGIMAKCPYCGKVYALEEEPKW